MLDDSELYNNGFEGAHDTDSSPPVNSGSITLRTAPIWNSWAGLDSEAAYWAKVYYSNLAQEDSSLPSYGVDNEPVPDPTDMPVADAAYALDDFYIFDVDTDSSPTVE